MLCCFFCNIQVVAGTMWQMNDEGFVGDIDLDLGQNILPIIFNFLDIVLAKMSTP